MELTVLQNQTQTTGLQGSDGEAVSQASASSVSASKSVLGGDGLSVRSTTDFEKLLAEMEVKRDKALQKSFKSQFSAAIAVLVGRHDNLSVAQLSAVDGVTAATDALSQAKADVAAAQSAYDASCVALAVETAKLEAMVEASVTTPEERVEEICKEEAQEELVQEELEQEELEQEEVAQEELAQKIQYTEEELQAQRDVVAAQQQVVDANLKALDAANAAKAEASDALTRAVHSLDSVSKGLVVEAVVISCRLLSAAAAERSDGETETQASAIIKAIGEYADKIQEMQDEELEEAVAKVLPDFVFLVTADYTVMPGDLPQYENRV